MTGAINLLKPPGMTSHDAVAFVRWVTGEKRVGHAGTLDPAAAGVLVVCLGRATRLADRLMAEQKTYTAGIYFGVGTDTGDAQGSRVSTGSLPQPQAVQAAMQGMLGQHQQVPPAYAAVKINGKPAYAYARQGEQVALRARTITLYDWQLLWQDGPWYMTRVTCSKGTYVRKLAEDLAARLGTVAHLPYLVRTDSGRFSIQNAVSCEQLLALKEQNAVAQVLATPEELLGDCPAALVPLSFMRRLYCGNAVPGELLDPAIQALPEGTPVRLMCNQQLVALGRWQGQQAAVELLLAEDLPA